MRFAALAAGALLAGAPVAVTAHGEGSVAAPRPLQASSEPRLPLRVLQLSRHFEAPQAPQPRRFALPQSRRFEVPRGFEVPHCFRSAPAGACVYQCHEFVVDLRFPAAPPPPRSFRQPLCERNPHPPADLEFARGR